jgi:hypothetical protein
MKFPDSLFPKTFTGFLNGLLKAMVKTEKALSGKGAAAVDKWVAALGKPDSLTATAAAERLGSLGMLISLPGIRQAMLSEKYAKDVLQGISKAHYHGKPEAEWRNSIYPLLLERATTKHPDPYVPFLAARLAMALNPIEATRGILKSQVSPELDVLIEVNRATRLKLPDDVLSLLGGVLLPHRDDLRLGPYLDQVVTRLADANWLAGPPDLTKLILEERTRQQNTDPRIRTPSRAFIRIENSGARNIDKIGAIDDSLDDRFNREGIEVGFNYDPVADLKHMTRPEWVIRSINHWVVGLENPGNLIEDCNGGLLLLKEMEEVGLPGCVKALQAIAVLQDEEQMVYTREEAGELSEDEAGEEVARLIGAMEKAESDAKPESWEECATALWAYAVQHQLQILPEP